VGDCPPQKCKFYQEINYAEQNGYLKILIACVWGNGDRERGVSCLSITFDYHKGHKPRQFPIEWALFKVSTTNPSIQSALI
jgi:hypothetical protein